MREQSKIDRDLMCIAWTAIMGGGVLAFIGWMELIKFLLTKI